MNGIAVVGLVQAAPTLLKQCGLSVHNRIQDKLNGQPWIAKQVQAWTAGTTQIGLPRTAGRQRAATNTGEMQTKVKDQRSRKGHATTVFTVPPTYGFTGGGKPLPEVRSVGSHGDPSTFEDLRSYDRRREPQATGTRAPRPPMRSTAGHLMDAVKEQPNVGRLELISPQQAPPPYQFPRPCTLRSSRR